MKVLKAPDYKDWKQICTCPRCKAELEYVLSDINGHFRQGGDCRDGGSPSSWSYTITCEICTQVIAVTKEKLNAYLEHVIQKRVPDNGPYGGGYQDR